MGFIVTKSYFLSRLERPRYFAPGPPPLIFPDHSASTPATGSIDLTPALRIKPDQPTTASHHILLPSRSSCVPRSLHSTACSSLLQLPQWSLRAGEFDLSSQPPDFGLGASGTLLCSKSGPVSGLDVQLSTQRHRWPSSQPRRSCRAPRRWRVCL